MMIDSRLTARNGVHRIRTLFAPAIVTAVVLVLASPAVQAEDESNKKADESNASRQAALEKKFEEIMSNCALVGHFTIDGAKNGPGREERYEIKKVSKFKGNQWTFFARVKYGNIDVTVPMTLPVLWAGDTPVITLTDLTIPGLGTFTSRVLIYEGRYVGTWQHGKVGGHMWGRIEKLAKTQTATPTLQKQ